MAQDDAPLTDAEREELEQLRAEKARREREELDELREEKAAASEARPPQGEPTPAEQPRERTRRVRTVTPEEAAQIEHDREVRARNAKLMEPDDDLNMPIGQKIVLVGVIVAAAIALVAIVFGPH